MVEKKENREVLAGNKIIYENIKHYFTAEMDRSSQIEKKAGFILVLAGLVGSLMGGSGSYSDLLNSSQPCIVGVSVFTFFISVVFLLLSIVSTILCFWVRTYDIPSKHKALIDKYKDSTEIEVIRKLAGTMASFHENNKIQNDNKMTYLKLGYYFILIGMMAVFINTIILYVLF